MSGDGVIDLDELSTVLEALEVAMSVVFCVCHQERQELEQRGKGPATLQSCNQPIAPDLQTLAAAAELVSTLASASGVVGLCISVTVRLSGSGDVRLLGWQTVVDFWTVGFRAVGWWVG